MLPSASFSPFGSNSPRRFPRIQNPSACNWIQPPTPSLAQGHNIHHGNLNNNVSPRSRLLPRRLPGAGVINPSSDLPTAMGEEDSSDQLRQSLPFPNAMSASTTNNIFRPTSLAELQGHSLHAPFRFNQVPCTTFATNTSPGAFVFSGRWRGQM